MAPRFSLVRGGIFYRLEQRAGLLDEKHLGIRKRILLFCCVTWIPILVLELLRMLQTGTVQIPHPLLTSRIGIHIRLFLAGPILIAAEEFVERNLAMSLAQFDRRKILDDPSPLVPILDDAQARISGKAGLAAETLAFIFVFIFTTVFRNEFGPYQEWRAFAPEAGFPPAIVWYLWVALPLLYFLTIRWAWRFAVWIRVLWGISRLPLRLNSAHPDLAGGLGFLGLAQQAFAPVWLAVSISVSCGVAFRMTMLKTPFPVFYAPIGFLIAIELLVLLGPLTFFVPPLVLEKRRGLFRYGALGADYVNDFDRKWIQGLRPADEPFLGSSDIEQWANIGIGLERSEKMKPFPATLSAIVSIVLAGVLPFLPLAFLAFPAEQMLRAALKLLF